MLHIQPKERERKPTIFKRVVDASYMLKLQAARKVFTEIKAKYPALPFSLRYAYTRHSDINNHKQIKIK